VARPPRARAKFGRHAARGVLAAALILIATSATLPATTQYALDPQTWVGRKLVEVLSELQQQGQPLIYSSSLVSSQAQVPVAPEGATPLELIQDLLRPHGLAIRVGDAGLWLVVRVPGGVSLSGQVVDQNGAPIAGARVAIERHSTRTQSDGTFRLSNLPGTVARLRVEAKGHLALTEQVNTAHPRALRLVLSPLPITREEIMVSARDTEVPRDNILFVGSGAVASDAIAALPEVAGDRLRAATNLPGVSNRFSARPLIRGGAADEVGILVDGVELYEPYHLLDYGGLFSIIPARAVGAVQVGSGNRDASYGDRLAGVIALTTAEPNDAARFALELSPLTLAAHGAGRLANERLTWLAAGRFGLLDRLARAIEVEDDVRLWDGFLKADWSAGNGHSVRASALLSVDDLDTTLPGSGAASTSEASDFLSHSSSRYVWVAHDNVPSARLFLEGVAAYGHIERRRSALDLEGSDRIDIFDGRRLGVQSWREDLVLLGASGTSWQLGAEARYLDAHYSYRGTLDLGDPIAILRTHPATFATSFDGEIESWQSALYAQTELEPTQRLGLVLGARLERDDLSQQTRLSPRLHLVHQTTDSTRWTFSAATYTQFRRPNELRVEDDEQTLDRPEHAEELALGLQHEFGKRARMRLEAWHRTVDDPQMRWTNLFDPLSLTPEAASDRILLVPDRSWSRGAHASLSFAVSGQLETELTLGLVRARDVISGHEVLRESDRQHDVRWRLGWRPPQRSWEVDASWRYQSGWPITSLTLDTDTRPVLGPLFGQRLPAHHQLDLQYRKRFDLARGSLTLDLTIENALNEHNVRGRDYAVERNALGDPVLVGNDRLWPGILPSFRIQWGW
jgi:hypothetical protein